MNHPSRPNRPGLGLLILTLAPGLAGCGGEPPKAAPELRPVRTLVVEPTAGGVTRTLAGVARAGVESRLSFRVPGTVAAVEVALGDRVRRGEILARLDPTDYELKLEEAEAGLAQAEAGLRRAEADYERVRALYENENASKGELDAARAGAESAQAQMESGEKRLEQARQQVGYTVLRAPSDGDIAAVSVEVNENVGAGQQVFLHTAGAEPEIEVAVPEVLIAEVAVGQPVEARFDALPGRRLAAEITEVGVAATGGANTFQVTAGITEPAPEVRSGMAAEVTFTFAEERGERIVVPGVAVGEDRDGRFVFVLERGDDGTGTARRRAVEIGEPVEGLGGIEILRGLSAGEEVITAGVRRLNDGMAVKILAAGPGESAA
jgi:multidrug efflux system membrane fusion protein